MDVFTESSGMTVKLMGRTRDTDSESTVNAEAIKVDNTRRAVGTEKPWA